MFWFVAGEGFELAAPLGESDILSAGMLMPHVTPALAIVPLDLGIAIVIVCSLIGTSWETWVTLGL